MKTNLVLPNERWLAMRWFVYTALVVLAGAGLTAAAIAHAPSRQLVWMVAYLVLVAGLVQAALGAGQALLADSPPSAGRVIPTWIIFNAANAGVIAGTLASAAWLVGVGTLLFIAAMLLFPWHARGGRGGWLRWVYYTVIGVVLVGALTGLSFVFL